MKKFTFIFLLTIFSVLSKAQVTSSPIVGSQNNDATIEVVELTDDETIVIIKYPRQKQKGSWVQFSSATTIMSHDLFNIHDVQKMNLEYPEQLPPSGYESLHADIVRNIREQRGKLKDMGVMIKHLGLGAKLDTKYLVDDKKRDYYYFELHFDRIPHGYEDIFIRELMPNGFEWLHIQINNPFPKGQNLGFSEEGIKQNINNVNDGIVGIYESIATNDTKYTLACVYDNGVYKLLYMDSERKFRQWKMSDVKAILQPSATKGLFKANWYLLNKTISNDCYVTFEGATMSVMLNGEKHVYIKMFPIASSGITQSENTSWTGTGFALNMNYIVTNYHVIENANSISIKGVNGNFADSYNAEVVAMDKFNDLALIRITDEKFNGFNSIPYKIKTEVSDVGEEIFVLGYPMTSTMGDEVKLTTGVVSSRTGFQGDMSLYQISAPIQPGNSGAPLFDSRGNIIGIVNAKHNGAENVGYAIKSSYLKNLIDSSMSEDILPNNNQIGNLQLTQKVKEIRDFVFIINCTSK